MTYEGDIMTIGSLDRSLRSPETHMTKWHILIGCILTKLWVLKGKIWCRSWLPFIFWQIKLCKPLSTHTHNVGMVYKKKTDLKKLSKQFTMPTGTNGHGNNNWERRDEKKNPRICYPFPIVLCIGKNEEKRIIILLLCTLAPFFSFFLALPPQTFSHAVCRMRFSFFHFPIFALIKEQNLMVKCFLSLLKFIICKIRPRDS